MLSFHVKFVQADRQTTVKQYAPDLSMRGHKKSGRKSYERCSLKRGLNASTKSFGTGQSARSAQADLFRNIFAISQVVKEPVSMIKLVVMHFIFSGFTIMLCLT